MTPSSLPLLSDIQHRPWAPPKQAWLLAQQWHHLLFAHWAVSPDVLRSLIPADLQTDTFDGQAWVGVVPFRMVGVRFHGLPPIPTTTTFPELNVRTYVIAEGKPGVWFFSLDAGSRAVVEVARQSFHLPYFKANMTVQTDGDEARYTSRRTDRRGGPAEFVARYRPISEVYRSTAGTLDYWLTERYCLYAVDSRGRLYRGEIHHAPWPLQRAEAEIKVNTMAQAQGIALPNAPPLLHYARRLEVVAWAAKALDHKALP
jgi:uncharacterized protein YqjF (DUF2071 family)